MSNEAKPSAAAVTAAELITPSPVDYIPPWYKDEWGNYCPELVEEKRSEVAAIIDREFAPLIEAASDFVGRYPNNVGAHRVRQALAAVRGSTSPDKP